DLDVPFVFDEKYIPELNLCADFAGYRFQPNRLPGRYAVLFPTRSDHGVHRLSSSRDKLSLYRKGRSSLIAESIGGRILEVSAVQILNAATCDLRPEMRFYFLALGCALSYSARRCSRLTWVYFCVVARLEWPRSS